jgi:hypothetical protein
MALMLSSLPGIGIAFLPIVYFFKNYGTAVAYNSTVPPPKDNSNIRKEFLMKTEAEFPYWDEQEDVIDKFEDLVRFTPDSPKQSSIRRRDKSREKNFVPAMSFKSRKKLRRQSIRTDLRFWEE